MADTVELLVENSEMENEFGGEGTQSKLR